MAAHSYKGITLAELLVSLVVVGVVMVGVTAADHAFRRLDRENTHDSTLYVRAMALAEMIRKDANLAVGSALSPGVQIDTTANNFLCFRQDNNHDGSIDNNPGTVAPFIGVRDSWQCYSKPGDTAADVDVFKCTKTIPAGPSVCAVGDTGYQYVGKMAWDVFTIAPNPPTFVGTKFTFTLIDRDDPTSAQSISNPEVRIPINVNPPAYSAS
ncbi:MAG: prepilin-type N-terminal cleavage/methylation domain-containing protein [Candidatus Omnitrophica bacterium]|nr:prepilin-type N-terminal cleavage/methylation domain-containing protein [Candidatus Omnitrophota bacterium]